MACVVDLSTLDDADPIGTKVASQATRRPGLDMSHLITIRFIS